MAKKNSMQWFIDIHNKSQPNDKKRISPVKSYRNAFSHGTKADKKSNTVKNADAVGNTQKNIKKPSTTRTSQTGEKNSKDALNIEKDDA